MVRLGIVSDSHGSEFWTQRFLDAAVREKYDSVFHLGDGSGDARWLKRRLEEAGIPLTCVAGNCDIVSREPREAFANYEGHRILAVHGHMRNFDVKYGLTELSYYAEERGADIALYGHTHIANASYVGPVLMINPGALMKGYCAELVLDGKRVVPHLKSL